MNTVCFYFEVHQPYRLRPYHFLDIGGADDCFDDEKNRAVMRKVGDKCYLPMTDLLLELIEKYGQEFRCTFAVTGTALEQFRDWYPEVLDNFKRLADTGCVEFLGETYYHSLASLFSDNEFREQVRLHSQIMRGEFGVQPTAFRNTELVYSNHIAGLAADLGFHGLLMEGADRVLDWRSPNFVYRPRFAPHLKVLTKNYRLSDDIAFRFSDRSWSEWPLSADKFAEWTHAIAGGGQTLNLFMDFETFGEHQWADSGVFEFMRDLPGAIRRHPDFHFQTVSETMLAHPAVGDIDAHDPVSWADTERDLSAWLGNSMQREAIEALYELEGRVQFLGDARILEIFRRLQTSDHFYYMCTKFFNDGDVHKYFSPYETPHEAYVYYMNALQDLRQRIKPRPARTSKSGGAGGRRRTGVHGFSRPGLQHTRKLRPVAERNR
ncbi:MAG: glycoside hydrolase family 57 protein [bacterium]|nr:glycoside hydrolase family 57 protein [bacterium]